MSDPHQQFIWGSSGLPGHLGRIESADSDKDTPADTLDSTLQKLPSNWHPVSDEIFTPCEASHRRSSGLPRSRPSQEPMWAPPDTSPGLSSSNPPSSFSILAPSTASPSTPQQSGEFHNSLPALSGLSPVPWGGLQGDASTPPGSQQASAVSRPPAYGSDDASSSTFSMAQQIMAMQQALQQQQHQQHQQLFTSQNTQMASAAAMQEYSNLIAFHSMQQQHMGSSGSPKLPAGYSDAFASALSVPSGPGSGDGGFGAMPGEMSYGQLASRTPGLADDLFSSAARLRLRSSSGLGTSSATGPAPSSPRLTPALAQVAAERGLDESALAMLLQNPAVMEMLSASASAPSTLGAPQQNRTGRQQQPGSSSLGVNQTSSPSALGRPPVDFMRRGAGPGTGSGPPPGSLSSTFHGMPSQPTQQGGPSYGGSAQLLNESCNAKTMLVQLMMSAFAFLSSDGVRLFFDSLGPLTQAYASMHDLPVVQKRNRNQEMAAMREQLMLDAHFVQILQAVCALRHHLYSLSRKVLLLNQQSIDAVPIDLLLGSMSSELFHVLTNCLPQEVLDFFGNNLPHPKLAVLVFNEFTKVDPVPLMA